ncbi:MAG: beta-propeller fold lactonase family protein [bacterium]
MTIKKNLLGLVVTFLVIQHTLFSASIDGTTSVKYLTENQVFRNGEYARGYVKLKSGATILSSCSALFNTQEPLGGGLDLRQNGALSLEGPIYFDSNFTLSGSGIIKGNGKIIFLNGNLTIPDNSIIHINSNTIIDGQGKNLIFGKRGRIFVDTNITLTLRNMKIVQTYNDFSAPCIRLAALKSNLTLDNVELSLFQDFLFPEGQLFIHGDVAVTGTSAFIYQSTQHTFIAPESTFYFDIGTTFSVVPATITDCGFDQWPTYTSSNFVVMTDATSRLCFNEASLCTTPTGCRFTKGVINFNNKCFIKSNSALNFPEAYFADTFQYAQTGNLPICVDYSPTGSYVAIVNQVSNTLQIFDSATLTQIGSDVITGSAPVSVSWSNTSTQIAVANSGDDTVKVYNFNGSGTPTLSASASTSSQPSCVAWSPYGSAIAVTNAGADTLQIFKSDTLAQIGSNATTGSNPSSVSWAPGDRLLAVTNSTSNTLQIFSFDGSSTPIQEASESTDFTPVSVSWSANGIFLAVANKITNTVQIFSFDSSYTLNLIDTIHTDYTPVSTSWSSDGKYLAFINYTSNTLWYLPFFEQSLHTQIGSDAITASNPRSVTWSPSSNYMCVAGVGGVQVYSFDGSSTPINVSGTVGLYYEAASWSPSSNYIATVEYALNNLTIFLFTPPGSLSYVANIDTEARPASVSWSTSGNYIAVVNRLNALRIYTFTPPSTLSLTASTALGSIPNCVSWAPQGNYLAVVRDSVLEIFSFTAPSTLNFVGSVPTEYIPLSVSWDPTSKYLAVSSIGSGAGAHNLEIFSFTGSMPTLINSLRSGLWPQSVFWSPDGRFISVVDRYSYALQSFSVNKMEDIIQVGDNANMGDLSSPWSVAWAPNGKFIAEVNNDVDTLKVFSLIQSSAQLSSSKKVNTKTNPTSLSWSSTNTTIAITTSELNNLQMFELQSPELLSPVGNKVPYSSLSLISWSADSRFFSTINENSSELQVFSFNKHDSPTLLDTISTLTGPQGPAGVRPNGAAWSPVGNFIVVNCMGEMFQDKSSLQVFEFNGTDLLTRLAANILSSELAMGPISWSPDGRFFAIDTYQSVMKVYSFNGANIIQVGSDVILGILYPGAISWSPDGRFISIAGPNTYVGNVFQIYIFDGVNTPAKVGGDVKTGISPASVSWSPDGRFLAVCNGGSKTLQIFSFNGTDTPVQVGGNASTEGNPDTAFWSSDGRFIITPIDSPNELRIFSFDGVNTPVMIRGSIPDVNPGSTSLSPDGNFFAVTNDGLQVLKINFIADRTLQAISNGVVFGNSKLGSDYDATVNLLAGANVDVDGLVNYDCVN